MADEVLNQEAISALVAHMATKSNIDLLKAYAGALMSGDPGYVMKPLPTEMQELIVAIFEVMDKRDRALQKLMALDAAQKIELDLRRAGVEMGPKIPV